MSAARAKVSARCAGVRRYGSPMNKGVTLPAVADTGKTEAQ